jgi:predicted kinase
MLKFPGASRKTIPMQEVRENDAVILACDVTAQHLKTVPKRGQNHLHLADVPV